MATVEEYRRTGYEIAEAIAPSWERRRAQIEEVSAPVREWLIAELAPRAGDTVLELAAGVGDTGFEAARIVGDRGRLISTDFSPRMVEAARRRGAELGLRNVEYRVLDAERIELADDSVDGVLCRFGYMLMADRAAALAETRRVLRPGGRLALAVFGVPERNPFFAVVGRLLVERGHMPPPDPDGPGILSMGREEDTRALLEEAGFANVRTEEVPVRFQLRDVDDYLALMADASGPIAVVLRRLSQDELEALKPRLAEAFVPFAGGGGYEIPGVALAAVAS